MSAPRRHSDFDVLEPEDVHPRGKASFEQLREAYNLTPAQAQAVSGTVPPVGRPWDLTRLPQRTQDSMVKRCFELFVLVPNLCLSDLGHRVARALRDATALAQAVAGCERGEHGGHHFFEGVCQRCKAKEPTT